MNKSECLCERKCLAETLVKCHLKKFLFMCMMIKCISIYTYGSPDEAKAANDSRLLRPNNVCGTRDIVTTECRRPDDVDAYVS